jgi:hypothetical protein
MARTPAQVRAQRAVDACVPVSPIGAELLRRYHVALEFGGANKTEDEQVHVLYELCRLVAEIPFPTLSIEALEQAAVAQTVTRYRAKCRHRAVRQLIRLLQAAGDLPDSDELAASRRIQEQLAKTPTAGRGTLRRWLAKRQHRLGWHELSWEAKRLRKLEEVLTTASADLDDRDIIAAWIRTLVRQIVDCGHHPVTRANDPARCNQCGATVDSHGRRPSPGERKQKELRRTAAAYLRFRRLPTPTSPL